MQTEFVFVSAPFVSCHAATIVETTGGMVAAWFGGEEEGSSDVGIWTSRRDSGSWSEVTHVASGLLSNGGRCACWNPVLFAAHEKLLLFYKVGNSPRDWWGMLMRSSDTGITWSQAERLPDGILGPIKNKPVQLSNGDLLCGASSEQSAWRVHMELTSDLGKTWTKTGPLNDSIKLAAIQPTIFNYPSGEIQILCRTRQGNIAESRSRDQGQTWSRMELMGLPNPDSGIDGVVLRDGRGLLVYNHSKTKRSPLLNVAVSSDDGRNWHKTLTLESRAGEYSYPSVIQTPDELVHIVYTWNRKRIKHVALDPRQDSLSSTSAITRIASCSKK
jgi:predicted neuraminidase